MVRKYYLEIGELEQNELDMSLFEYGMEEYVWWENQNQCLVTDNPKVLTDLEHILEDLNIDYQMEEEEE